MFIRGNRHSASAVSQMCAPVALIALIAHNKAGVNVDLGRIEFDDEGSGDACQLQFFDSLAGRIQQS